MFLRELTSPVPEYFMNHEVLNIKSTIWPQNPKKSVFTNVVTFEKLGFSG